MINNPESRLDSVFKSVFRNLPNEHEQWNVMEVKGWDSIAHMILMNAIEQEFSITIPKHLYLQCTGYDRILDIIEAQDE